MARNIVGYWSTNPDENADIGGINVAEFCPPLSLNNAIRAIMARVATWLTTLFTKAGGAVTGAITDMLPLDCDL